MKKILYIITQSELGGAQKYIYDLTRSLQDDFEISVAFGGQGEEGELARLLDSTLASYFHIPHLVREISPAYELAAISELRALIKKLKPDIIHLNSSKASILGSLAAIGSKAKLIYTAHGWVFNEPLPEKRKNLYIRAERFSARFKDKIICVSEFDRQAGIDNSIAPTEKFITVHNGIEKPRFLSKSEAKEKLFGQLKEKYEDAIEAEETRHKFIIGSVGNLYKTKGFEYFITAVKILKDNGLDLGAVIIGDGPEKKELLNWISQERLNKNVFLAGRLNNAPELIPAFDIYVCSSVKEGLSYTLIEAMMAGLPIIATKVGGNSELIEDRISGRIIEPSSPEALANKIYKLIYDSELRKKYGQAAQNRAWSEFSLEKMVERTKEVYER